jgi:hypothetical protein
MKLWREAAVWWVMGVRHDYHPMTAGLTKAADDLLSHLPGYRHRHLIPGGHEIHMVQPKRYIDEVSKSIDDLQAKNRLPSKSSAIRMVAVIGESPYNQL